jgi:hypothetical protein
MERCSIVRVLVLAIAVMGLLVCPAEAGGKPKKKDNCIIVTITNWKNTTEVVVQYWDPTGKGQWVAFKRKTVRKNDNGTAEICGLKPGGKYQVKASAQGETCAWTPFIFQPDPETGTQAIQLTLVPIK